MKRVILVMLLILSFNVFGKVKEVDDNFLKSKISNENWIILDTRLTDAFNGWKMDGLDTGGHIKGASDFSYTWVGEKENLIKDNMDLRGISQEKNIILYDSNKKDYQIVMKYLIDKGFKNIYYFNLNNKSLKNLEMQSYPNYQTLVPAWWVKDLMDKKNVDNYDGKEVKIFETSWGNLKESASYVVSHIPGAIHINTDEVEPAPKWMLNSDQGLLDFAKNNGIKKDMTVVLYGEDVMASYRVAAVLDYLGVSDVRVLNGGFEAWKREDFPIERGINKKQPLADYDIKEIGNKNLILTVDQAKKRMDTDKDFQLVGIRSWKEHIGEVSGYSYFHKKGRPKGAIWGKGGTSSVTLEDYRNPDNTFKNGYLMIDMWKSLNINTNKDIAFFCGSGWRAGEVLIYSKVMGFKNTQLFSDGWIGWANSPKNLPIEIGK